MLSDFGRLEIVARRLLQHCLQFAHALEQLMVTAHGAGAQGNDVDVLPACELDDLLDLLVDPCALRRQVGGDARRILRVEAVHVVEQVAHTREGLDVGSKFLRVRRIY